MMTSERGRELIMAWEGCKLKPYKCAADKWTIGVGHLMSKQELIGYADGITKQLAMSILATDLHEVEQCIMRNVKVPLKQHEFDALASFIFNVGTGNFCGSTLLKKLNTRNYGAVPHELMKWTRANGNRCKGLVVRRERECALWRGEVE